MVLSYRGAVFSNVTFKPRWTWNTLQIKQTEKKREKNIFDQAKL